MHDAYPTETPASWNKGKLIGQKFPLKLHEVWSIRIRLAVANHIRPLVFTLCYDTLGGHKVRHKLS